MAGWGMVIAAAIGAAASIASSSMKGGAKAPAAQFGGTGGKKIETPDVFKESQGQPQTTASLAGALGGQPGPASFGPQGMDLFAQEEQKRKLNSLLGG
jgi:hypothetical protein